LDALMGHLIFAGLVVVLVIILVGGIYFRFTHATRNVQCSKIPGDIGEEEKWFYVKKWVPLFVGGFTILILFVLMDLFKDISEEPERAAGAWMLIDLAILALVVLALLFVVFLRSYVRIYSEGFECRKLFRAKKFAKADIDYVCRADDIVFVKLKSCRMPVIIEMIYNDNDVLYGMLCGLQSDVMDD